MRKDCGNKREKEKAQIKAGRQRNKTKKYQKAYDKSRSPLMIEEPSVIDDRWK